MGQFRLMGELRMGRGLLFSALSALVLISCSAPQKLQVPQLPLPPAFSKTGTDPLADKWWLAFEDEILNGLIREALAANLTLQGTWDRLEQSRAIAIRSGSERFATIQGTASAGRTASRTAGIGRSTVSDFSLGVSASYELDLWGRVRASLNAAELDVLVSKEDLVAAAISLSAEIASVWYRLVEQSRQIDLLKRQIVTNEKLVELVTLRFQVGQVPASDVLQQRQTLEATRGNLALAGAEEQVLANQLAVLRGRAPGAAASTDGARLPRLPPAPAAGLPVDVIQRRPDIRKAFYGVKAADERVAAAIADKFPKFSLTASTTLSGTGSDDLFQNWLANLAGNIVTPLFDAGSRDAEAERAKAAYDEALHSYQQAVLTSLREVEDAIVRETQQAAYLASLNRQLDLSQKSSEQTRQRYIRGDQDFLRFLNSLVSHQSLERDQVRARRELIVFRINLYRSIAGGWELERSRLSTRTERDG
ncbi:MAG: efflux transporter outer membrane subunit [SAR324 cluster bacterium]|nr:efflux transporter outer membrane subunit [SAR324 cluster bacterium]